MTKKKKTSGVNREKKKARAAQKRKQKKRGERSQQSNILPAFSRPMFSENHSERPYLAEMDAPDGFIALSVYQSMIRYAELVWDKNHFDTREELQRRISIGMRLWNYSISAGEGIPEEHLYAEVAEILKKDYGMQEKEIMSFIDSAVGKQLYYFPQDIQPEIAGIMYMRKFGVTTILEFNHDLLDYDENPLEPTPDDIKVLENLLILDNNVRTHRNYSLWKDEFEKIRVDCALAYGEWLLRKELNEYAGPFVNAIPPFLDYVYSYPHQWETTLNDLIPEYMEEFFFDYLLMRVDVKPQIYVDYAPAIEFFYYYLEEIGYMEINDCFIDDLDDLEEKFLFLLRQRYE
ncbi:MAG: hypothetical protein CVV64_17820 [Candidatus Wallbacteria bacterium HGW-Wallbacteria-1]|jgi:hypothetical protein|uniref:Uncharacterized protein n=1 Tax=Candidatus Wallbacteria bacterium HGW-Wallbacteria-1 TaxID=2013854 RepID=A0A2N1PJW8_9BACT|nr:MAG: hypothetical protein CVV64_17820 [Candidatus Wallbacteria bacterium HGW-Wallbacteria-1]